MTLVPLFLWNVLSVSLLAAAVVLLVVVKGGGGAAVAVVIVVYEDAVDDSAMAFNRSLVASMETATKYAHKIKTRRNRGFKRVVVPTRRIISIALGLHRLISGVLLTGQTSE